ncbi:calcium-binding protein, partial [Crocosphaera sp. XPORK-15E]|uniref:calcium-binding protein n=1 Tax=Crocosphaera sp. XPORK-15E TaxID=3110247 RepID=UPI002B1F65DA
TFTRTGILTNALTANYTIGGTATNGTDYTNIGTIVNFAANSATATVIVDPKVDTTVESNETVALTLASGTGYSIGTTTAVTGTINNDDDTSVTLGLNYSGISENSPSNFTYTFTRTGILTNALTVNYTVGGTATNGTDYTTIGSSVTFAANSATATVIVDPKADTTTESNETVALTLASGSGYAVGTTSAVTATIINDDSTRRQFGTNGVDVILGTTNADYIKGGLGSDILTGGSNGDTFFFASANEGNDQITDFTPNTDSILVSGSGFGNGLVSGDTLAPSQFILGANATTSSQRFIYNASTGALWFDPDGSGASSATQLATLNAGLALTFEDIFVS